ncbi:hypothetical protein ACFWWM_00210 [Streptomyces sp. NPDC058682]|uniref:hypothetical protein n=1 Tax=Streptomyces sp. NPDC058682 TaxID=3346596 RepID=UPI0036568C4F
MDWPNLGRSLRTVASSFVPNVFQVGSLAFVAVAAYDVARPFGHFAVAVCLGLVGYATDRGKR